MFRKFWRLFNECFKEFNNTTNKYLANGCCSDMAEAIFNRLSLIYREDILQKVKGCEFHCSQAVEKKAKYLQVGKDGFKKLASALLTSTTAEAYHRTYNTLKTFIHHSKLKTLREELAW